MLLLPHEFPARTVTGPAVVPHFTTMVFVPCPDMIDACRGTVHVYVVAPAIAAVEYVTRSRRQTEDRPVMLVGDDGEPVMFIVLEPLLPQAFDATIEILPELNVDVNVTLTEFVPWPEFNVAPAGMVHV